MATDESTTRLGSIVLPPTPPVVLTSLPPDPSPFVGRSAVFETVLSGLTPRKAPAKPVRPTREAVRAWRRSVAEWERGSFHTSITGPPGSGRTALAFRVAREALARRWYSHVLYLDLQYSPALPLADSLAALLRALGVRPEDVPAAGPGLAALNRYLDVLTGLARRGQPVLVILDGADAHQLDRLSARHPRNHTLAVSTAGRPVPLLRLQEDDALALLRPALPTADPDSLRAVARACDRQPSALHLAAAQLAADPALLGRLGRTADVTRFVYRHLPPAHARLFRLASLHLGPYLRVGEAAALARLTVAEAATALEALTAARLLTKSRGSYRYQPHSRDYARKLALDKETDDARREAVQRLLDHYTGYTGAGTRAEDARTLAAAARLAYESGFPDDASTLTLSVATLLDADARTAPSVWYAVHQFAAHCADIAREHARAGRLWQRLGHRRSREGKKDTGAVLDCYGRAVTAFRAAGESAAARAVLADVLRVLPQSEGAPPMDARSMRDYEQAADLLRRSGEPAALAAVLSNLGNSRLGHNQPEEAESCHTEALSIRRSLDDAAGLARSTANLGNVAFGRHEPEQALFLYRRALALFEGLGDAYGQARTLSNIGRAEVEAERGHRARKAWRAARALFRAHGHDREAENLGQALGAPGWLRHVSARPWTHHPDLYVFPDSLTDLAASLDGSPTTEPPSAPRGATSGPAPYGGAPELPEFERIDLSLTDTVPDLGHDYSTGDDDFSYADDFDDDGPDYDWDD
ncbi:tetratricopeptide repeat protein [Kitasatospora sp. NPDC051170]|uniref:tetratricopeptide repeat protein n=1 Tax=Kitasatospora sp. NPDC051170 TaxID=3364056 RepID=UPI0037A0B030